MLRDRAAVFLVLLAAACGEETQIDTSSILNSARAGVMTFGATTALEATIIQCSAFDLTIDDGELPGAFDDLGDNRCGCPVAAESCAAVTTNLSPPEPLDPL